jgi:hypothetical protein
MEATAIPTLNKNGNIDLTKQERIENAGIESQNGVVMGFLIGLTLYGSDFHGITPFLLAFVFGVVAYFFGFITNEKTQEEHKKTQEEHTKRIAVRCPSLTKHEETIYNALTLKNTFSVYARMYKEASTKRREQMEKEFYMAGILTQVKQSC